VDGVFTPELRKKREGHNENIALQNVPARSGTTKGQRGLTYGHYLRGKENGGKRAGGSETREVIKGLAGGERWEGLGELGVGRTELSTAMRLGNLGGKKWIPECIQYQRGGGGTQRG